VRSGAGRRIDRAAASVGSDAAPTTPVGCVLAGADAVADAGSGCVLGSAATGFAQGHALASGEVEGAFRTLKSDPAIRPIFLQGQQCIEAHVFIAFLAYCLYVTLGRQLKPLAQGLTARSA
jgi:hypothetical protein